MHAFFETIAFAWLHFYEYCHFDVFLSIVWVFSKMYSFRYPVCSFTILLAYFAEPSLWWSWIKREWISSSHFAWAWCAASRPFPSFLGFCPLSISPSVSSMLLSICWSLWWSCLIGSFWFKFSVANKKKNHAIITYLLPCS